MTRLLIYSEENAFEVPQHWRLLWMLTCWIMHKMGNVRADLMETLSKTEKWDIGGKKEDKEGEGKQENTGVSAWLDTMSLLWSKHAEIPIAHLTLTWLVSSLIWQACQGGRTNWGRECSATNYSCWICRPSLFCILVANQFSLWFGVVPAVCDFHCARRQMCPELSELL